MKKAYTFKLDPILVEKLDKLAKSQHRSRTNMIESLIIEAKENE